MAHALEISTNSTAEDIRLMIGVKLETMDRDPSEVQVAREENQSTCVILRDATGVFLEVKPLPPESGSLEKSELNLVILKVNLRESLENCSLS